MNLPLFLTGKDVAKGMGVSLPTAYRRMSEFRQTTDFPKYKRINAIHFLNFFQIEVEFFYKNLNR